MDSVRLYNQTSFQAFYLLKKHFAAFAFVLLAFSAQAQVGVGTLAPDPSAQFEVQSPNKGVLIPRMNQASRNLISNPANGLLIYQTDATPGFYYYDGATWQPLKTPATPPGGGAIIPYASGLPVAMTTVLGGLLNTSAAIGFGSSVGGLSQAGGIIDITGAPGTLLNMAFSVPKAGTISSMSAYFSSTAALVLLGSVITITAQLYHSTAPNNTFTPVPGAVVTLAPSLTGILSLGTVSNGITSGLSIPVAAGDRLMLVYTANVVAGLDVATTIVGYASAGVAIN